MVKHSSSVVLGWDHGETWWTYIFELVKISQRNILSLMETPYVPAVNTSSTGWMVCFLSNRLNLRESHCMYMCDFECVWDFSNLFSQLFCVSCHLLLQLNENRFCILHQWTGVVWISLKLLQKDLQWHVSVSMCMCVCVWWNQTVFYTETLLIYFYIIAELALAWVGSALPRSRSALV